MNWLCRTFGHRMRPVLTENFWVAVEYRCSRCGASGSSVTWRKNARLAV